jgi:DNA-binding CsgD family transcriptional regulator
MPALPLHRAGGAGPQSSGYSPAEWPFTGRDQEIRHLVALLSDPGQCGVVIAGPAGAGKTRLALECLRRAGDLGFAVARVTGTAALSMIPLAALAHLAPGASAARDSAGMLRQVRAGLLDRAGGRRLAVVADDAHLLDDASAAVLCQLMTAGQAFVLFTAREREPAPDALMAAWKDEIITRLDLAGPDRRETGELLAALLGHVDPEAVAVLAHLSGGDRLMLRELVFGALRDRSLASADGLWRLAPPLTPSPSLIELVESRLRGLDPADRALIEVIAVGEPLSLTELSRVHPAGRAEALESTGVIACEQAGGQVQVRLAYPVYGEVLRARMPVLRTRSIATRLAAATDRSDLLRNGRLLLLSGTGDRGALLAAAGAARWAFAIPLAQQLADAALACPAGPATQFEADLLAAELAGLQGRWQEADERLAKLATAARDDAQRARVAIAAMDNCLYAGLPEQQLQVSRRAEAAAIDPHWREEIRARRSPVLVMREGPRSTWAEVVSLTGAPDGPVLVWAALTGARALGRMGQAAAALELSHRGHEAHLALTEPIAWYPWYHLFNRCEILMQAGRLADAEELAREQHLAMIADHCAEGQAAFASQLALVLTARGQGESAALLAREAREIFRNLGRPMFARQAAERLAAALCASGRARESDEALHAAGLHAATPDSDPAYLYNAVDLLHTRAWVAAAAGLAGRARAELSEMARLARKTGDLAGLSAALHSAARLGDAKRPVGNTLLLAQMEALAQRVDGAFFPARLAHVRGLASGEPVVLEQAASAFAEIGARALAAEAAADAATLWIVRGEPRRSAAACHLARVHLAQCQGAGTPALRSVSSRSLLTPAERDAAELAARGYSNKAIAAQLFLSVRSVENRLQHVYEKLAINSRTDLADALRFERSAP